MCLFQHRHVWHENPGCMDDDYRYLYERNDYYMKFRGFDELNDSDLVDED